MAFRERLPGAQRFVAEPPALCPDQFHRAGDRDIANPLETALLPPKGHNTTARAARRIHGFDCDSALPEGQRYSAQDPVSGQVEDHGGSVNSRRSSLRQGSWFLFKKNA